MTRTRGLASLALVALGLLCLATERPATADEPTPRPNIVVAIADDWSWPHAGVYGDKVVKTPTFDRVAAEGMLFSHTFSVTPSCTASRAAIQRRLPTMVLISPLCASRRNGCASAAAWRHKNSDRCRARFQSWRRC